VATHKSAEKRARQRTKRNLRNKKVAGVVRASLKRARTSVDSTAKDAGDNVAYATSQLDKAVTRKVMHKKKAARLISRLAKRVNKATAKKS
jgi:small subunit ribosomal protein S20